jgi:ChrR-like protein with cupin domain
VPKPEREFADVGHLPWVAVTGSASAGAGGAGIEEKVLSRDPQTGDVTRLLRFAPGVRTAETIVHDFWEEVFILEGAIVDVGLDRTFTAGMYACRPPGMKHGPYASPEGALLFETRYRA